MPLSVPDRDDWFDDDPSFPRPNWGAVNGWMRVFVPEAELGSAWEQCTRHWLNRLRQRLGGTYVVAESENFYLLMENPSEAQAKLLSFVERTRTHIHKVLGDTAPPEARGKHVVLRFTETDDYYAYISHFHPDGEFAGSGGMFFRDGYQHLAYPQSWSPDEERRTVAHELTHDLLAHLPLPPWLNEALAMAFETDIAGGSREPLSRELAARHRSYWDAKTIQEFWRGESFANVEGQELAYSLASILLNLIHTEIRPAEGEFRRFVLRSDWGDAGAIATREHLEVELEDLVASFLGPGTWAPRPDLWKMEPPSDDAEELPAA
jgi:hypothetical protein